MQKKKLAILINALEVAGAEKVVAQIINYFYRTFDIHLVLLNNTIEYELPLNDITVKIIDNSNLQASNRIIDILKTPLLAKRLKKYLQQQDIDTCFSVLNRSNFINCFLRILDWKGTILISERSHTSSAYDPNTFAGKTGRFLVKKLYPFANVIVPNSAGIEYDLTKHFSLTNKFIVINNPVNIKIQEKDMCEAVEDFTFDSFTFSHVGRIEKGKNHELLLKAICLIKELNFKVLIIGQGQQSLNIKIQAKELGISDKVIFLGYRKNVVKYITRSQCHIVTSNFEGFPNVLLEALACATPVISTDCPTGPRELLSGSFDPNIHINNFENASFGILTPVNDATTLAKAMSLMIANEKLRTHYSQAGKLRTNDFGIEKIMLLYERIFNNW